MVWPGAAGRAVAVFLSIGSPGFSQSFSSLFKRIFPTPRPVDLVHPLYHAGYAWGPATPVNLTAGWTDWPIGPGPSTCRHLYMLFVWCRHATLSGRLTLQYHAWWEAGRTGRHGAGPWWPGRPPFPRFQLTYRPGLYGGCGFFLLWTGKRLAPSSVG